jgi:hypothetical protein
VATELQSLRFRPARVEGLDGVAEVEVFPDRLEVLANGERCIIRFDDIAQWPRPRWFWRLVARCGWRPSWLPVGERDWFRPPPERFFPFFTTPRITIFLPDDPEEGYGRTLFRRAQVVMSKGGYSTIDLG